MITLVLDRFNKDGSVSVRHIFYGDDEDEVIRIRNEHVNGCEALTKAEQEGRIGEFLEEIEDDEVPYEDSGEYDEEEECDEEEEDGD